MITPSHHITASFGGDGTYEQTHVITAPAEVLDNGHDVDQYIRSTLAGHGYEPVGEWEQAAEDPHLSYRHVNLTGKARPLSPPTQVDTGPNPDDIANWFTYHPPRPDQIELYESLRAYGLQLARAIEDLAPPSRERSTAIAKVREAVMWANAAIACNPTHPEEQQS
jgi:hypothetical protein